LKLAQEGINDEQIETGDSPVILDERYQIINSFLPSNGNYQIENRMYEFLSITREYIFIFSCINL
jgi:hypothetical protein